MIDDLDDVIEEVYAIQYAYEEKGVSVLICVSNPANVGEGLKRSAEWLDSSLERCQATTTKQGFRGNDPFGRSEYLGKGYMSSQQGSISPCRVAIYSKCCVQNRRLSQCG